MFIKTFLFIFILFVNSSLYSSSPKILLLKNYKNQDIKSWVMSEKLDGIRAIWNGKNLITRSGKIIHAPSWFIKDYPPFSLDGELWTKRADFENISSIVSMHILDHRWKNIKHYIFEVPEAYGNLFKRLEKAKKYENKYIVVLKQIKIKNKKHMYEYLKTIEDLKGEGLVLRDPRIAYINKRTSKALKVKTFHDMECKLISYNEGKGKFIGLIGSITCELENKTLFKIGSVFTIKQRKNPPALGSIITFKYKEFTKYNKPRFPVFLRIKKEF